LGTHHYIHEKIQHFVKHVQSMNGGYEEQNTQHCERIPPPMIHQPKVLRLPFHTRSFNILGLSQRSVLISSVKWQYVRNDD
jgi:hypothetical protein